MTLIKSPNTLHWNQKRNKVVVVLGQNLGQIRSDVVKKVKKQALSIGFFFHILHVEYLLKQILVVLQSFEWKLEQV